MAIKIKPTYRIPSNKRIMTTREHERMLNENGINVKPLEMYRGLEIPILYEYPCGHQKRMRPATMKASNLGRCLVCYPNIPPASHQYTTDEFIMQMSTILPSVQIIGDYTRSDEPIHVKCLNCGFEWSPIAHTLKQGHGCLQCKYLSSRISSEEFNDRVSKWHYSFEVLSEYRTLTDYYKCKCKQCGNEWNCSGGNLISGKAGCLNCFTNSKGEYLIKQLLTEWNIEYIPQHKYKELIGKGGKPLIFDIYIPSCNLLIEYQGIQHEKPIDRFGGEKQFEAQLVHDQMKREFANRHKIKLLEIWYYDYENIEEILKRELNLVSLETDTRA